MSVIGLSRTVQGQGYDSEQVTGRLQMPVAVNLLSIRRPISKGEVIGFYTGEVLSTNELDTCYPNFEGSEYVMQIGPDTYIDAKDPEKSSFTRYGGSHDRLAHRICPPLDKTAYDLLS